MGYQIKRLLEVIIIFSAFIAFAFVMIGVGTYFYYAPVIANKSALLNNNSTGLTLLDNQDQPFFTFYQAKNKKYAKLSEISDLVESGTVAVEDKEFYTHNGVSIRGILRSILYNLEERKFAFGGSTITQQLVKNTLLTSERSIARKVKEIILAQEVERRYTKEEILEMYLNSVYYGRGAFGIEQAANVYFGKHASTLDLSEASFLIGLLPSPSILSSGAQAAEEAKSNQQKVLDEMYKNGDISERQKLAAEEVPLTFTNTRQDLNVIAPHFALMVREELIKKYGEEVIVRSGFRVKTTLDATWQRATEEVVARNVSKLSRNNVTNGAAVVMIPESGEIRALVGSVDWYDDRFGKVNMATVPRQPGSSFKPIVYATAFEDRLITPATVLQDSPTTFKIQDCQVNCLYKPKDYDGRFRGKVLVRRALANSLNIPAVYVMNKVGVPRVLDKAQDLGIGSLGDASNYGLSMVLGAAEVPLIEMTGVYSSFANRGERAPVSLYTQIVDKRGKTIETKQEAPVRVWSENAAFMISSILSDNRARTELFGNSLTVSRPAAVKTGTTEDYRDAWTLGYTPDLAVGVWVGNNDNASMDRIAGSLGAAPIWMELIEKFSAGTLARKFEPPGGIVKVAACFRGEEAATGSAAIEYFIPGTEPTRGCILPPSSVAKKSFEAGVGGAPPTGTEEQKKPDDPTESNTKNEENKDNAEQIKIEELPQIQDDNEKERKKSSD